MLPNFLYQQNRQSGNPQSRDREKRRICKAVGNNNPKTRMQYCVNIKTAKERAHLPDTVRTGPRKDPG